MNPGETSGAAEAAVLSCSTCGSADVLDEACPRCGRESWLARSDAGERVFRPRGDLIRTDPLDQFLGSVELRPGERLILDLSDVRSIGSEALGRLFALRKRLLDVQGRLVLRRLDPDLLEILQVTRVASFFEIEP